MLLMICLMTISIAFGQLSTDSVTITRKQQRECIKWYYESTYKDSIIIHKDSIIIISDERIRVLEADLLKSFDKQDEQAQSIQKLKRRKKRAWIFGSIGGFVAGILATILIM